MIVEIRKTRLYDAEELHRNINDNEPLEGLSQLRRVKRNITRNLKEWKIKRTYAFTIFADEKIVGQIFLENPSMDQGRYEIGFYVGKKHWGKGIATQAIERAVKYGFDKLKLYKIWGDHDSDNPASGKAMEKAGLEMEGRLKKHSKKNGKFIDILMWGKTR